MSLSENVHSFIVRFVNQRADAPDRGQWRGLIRHVQSGTELYFWRIEEANEFMARFVPLAPPPSAPQSSREG